VKRDAPAPAFGLGSHPGAGNLACASSPASLAQPSPVGVRLLSLADDVRRSRPHITPLSSRDGNGRGSARTAGGTGSERAHSRVQPRPARGRATHFASVTAAPAVGHKTRVGLRTRLTTPRVQLASAGPSVARTQGAALGGAKGKPEDAATRSVSAAVRCAQGVVRRVRKKSTRPGDGFPRPVSTRPAGWDPAGVTQGERV